MKYKKLSNSFYKLIINNRLTFVGTWEELTNIVKELEKSVSPESWRKAGAF